MAQQQQQGIPEDEEDDYVDDGELEGEEEGQEGAAAGSEEVEEAEDEEEVAAPWQGINDMPEKEDVLSVLRELAQAGKKTLTVLLLGRSGAGMSSTINSLFSEGAARVTLFKLSADSEITTILTRQIAGHEELDGFKLKLIKTCGLEDPQAGDIVNYAALQRIAEDIKGIQIDAVLYMDRLDLYRVDPLDQAIMRAVSNTLGRRIWAQTIFVLTRGNIVQLPPGTTYDSFADRRVQALRSSVRSFLFKPQLPVVLIENSPNCPRKENKRVLPDESVWMQELYSSLADMALSRKPYKFHPRMTSKPNNSLKLLLPVMIAAQFLLWKKVVVPIMDKDLEEVQEAEDRKYAYKDGRRKNMGLHPHRRPSKEAAWRLEKLYQD